MSQSHLVGTDRQCRQSTLAPTITPHSNLSPFFFLLFLLFLSSLFLFRFSSVFLHFSFFLLFFISFPFPVGTDHWSARGRCRVSVLTVMMVGSRGRQYSVVSCRGRCRLSSVGTDTSVDHLSRQLSVDCRGRCRLCTAVSLLSV